MKINGPVWALGLMSGTSMDGVDAAMIRTDGERIFEFGDSAFEAYGEADRAILRQSLGAWQEDPRTPVAANVVERTHLDAMRRFNDFEMIGFHGQTLAHDPYAKAGHARTHQAGHGDALAQAMQIPCVWDFRTADVSLGGQGAPLAPFFHFACAKYLELTHPVAFLNLGGVGNITFVDPRYEEPDTPGAVLAFDTGPANALIDDLLLARLKQDFDKDGALAAKGRVDESIVGRLLENPYFLKMPPKSLDRDDFKSVQDWIAELSPEDAAATLTACSAAAVLAGLEHLAEQPKDILVCGGGRKNRTMMDMIRRGTNAHLRDIDETGLDGDMLEAQAFAHLAVRVARGLPTSCPSTTGVAASVGGGRISYPRGALNAS
ncbi:MAG: anhydro-N-acetylmuramic acid kinase [Pseudomonadota bacterium]